MDAVSVRVAAPFVVPTQAATPGEGTATFTGSDVVSVGRYTSCGCGHVPWYPTLNCTEFAGGAAVWSALAVGGVMTAYEVQDVAGRTPQPASREMVPRVTHAHAHFMRSSLRPSHKNDQASMAPEYTAMPATASTPMASSASTSASSLMPPATINCFAVQARRTAATSMGKPVIVPSVSTCV